MRKFIAGTLTGVIVGILGTLYIFSVPSISTTSATVETISGSPLSIGSIIRDRYKTTISAKYDGAGESKITIPEYRYYASLLISTDKSIFIGGGYMITQRITLLGGVWFRSSLTYSGGVYIGAAYRF